MKLSFFSIANYRSITKANKIKLSDFIVLLGQNNEGKTNILKALILAMNIICNQRIPRSTRNFYDWQIDFPVQLQNNKRIKKYTSIRLDFTLSKEEQDHFQKEVEVNINDSISIYIECYEKNNISITIPKKGKNSKTLSSRKNQVCNFIRDHFAIQYIPAIRSETDAMRLIEELVSSDLDSIDDKEYIEAQNKIHEIQENRLSKLSSRLQEQLTMFMPNIKSTQLSLSNLKNYNPLRSRTIFRNPLTLLINDGNLTDLQEKGDGVKSLISVALLSQIKSQKSQLIIVDEPETHLHPKAIRYIKNVLQEKSQQGQVIVSTHNPIFVNRKNITYNIVVEEGKVNPVRKLYDIRKSLGVFCADNLIYSDYVIFVEGPSDKKIIEAYFRQDECIKKCLDNNEIVIHSLGGINNLQFAIWAAEQMFFRYCVVIDNDDAGKNAVNKIKNNDKNSSSLNFSPLYFDLPKQQVTELEDLYSSEKINPYLQKKYDITPPEYRDSKKKWSQRVKARKKDLKIDKIKEDLADLVSADLNFYISDAGKTLLDNILKKIKEDINLTSCVEEDANA